MRKNTKRILVGVIGVAILLPIALFAFLWCSNRDSISWDEFQACDMREMPVEPQDFKADFEEIFKKVRQKYAYTDVKNLNMDSLHDAFLSRIDTLREKTDYGLLLREFFACLKTGHASVAFSPHHIGNDVIVVDGRVFISNPSEQALKAGFADKDEIVSVNNIPTAEWISDYVKYIPAPTEEGRRLWAAAEITYDYVDTLRTFGIIRDGKEMELQVRLLSANQRSGKEWHRVTKRLLTPQVGYIAINMLDEAAVVDTFVMALNEFRKCPYLIVDVRENGGGNSQYGDQIAGYLIKHDCKNWMERPLTVNKDRYEGEVYVLMGGNSFSAAETFLVELKESHDVKLVGEPSAGDMGGVVLPYRTSRGICYRIPTMGRWTTVGGHPSEGTPIEPDEVVHQTVDDFMAGKDTQVEWVLKRMKDE